MVDSLNSFTATSTSTCLRYVTHVIRCSVNTAQYNTLKMKAIRVLDSQTGSASQKVLHFLMSAISTFYPETYTHTHTNTQQLFKMVKINESNKINIKVDNISLYITHPSLADRKNMIYYH